MQYRAGSKDFFSAIIASVATVKPNAKLNTAKLEFSLECYWIDTD